MSPLLSCITPALVASCFGFASKIVMGVLLFTFKDHKIFVLNFLLTFRNRCVGNTGGDSLLAYLFYCDRERSFPQTSLLWIMAGYV